jgi:hypothetical protein
VTTAPVPPRDHGDRGDHGGRGGERRKRREPDTVPEVSEKP